MRGFSWHFPDMIQMATPAFGILIPKQPDARAKLPPTFVKIQLTTE